MSENLREDFLTHTCRLPEIQLGGLESAASLPSGVWGGAPPDIEFNAFFSSTITTIYYKAPTLRLMVTKYLCRLWPKEP